MKAEPFKRGRAQEHENWKSPSKTMAINYFEFSLFIDVHITGDILEYFGLHQFLNPIDIPRSSDSIHLYGHRNARGLRYHQSFELICG